MKLHKSLLINGQEHQIVQEDITLGLNRPGRAIFQVVSTEDVEGEVSFAMGWHFASTLTQYFTGTIDPKQTRRVDSKQVRLLCNEVSAKMDGILPLALRHPTLKDVLQTYSGLTGLRFILPDKSYATTKVPAFYGLGSGYHGLQTMGDVFSIPDYVWLTQGDGQIFVGSHADSLWGQGGLDIPTDMWHRARATGSKSVTVVPGVRPGAVINGERVRALRFSGHTMDVSLC